MLICITLLCSSILRPSALFLCCAPLIRALPCYAVAWPSLRRVSWPLFCDSSQFAAILAFPSLSIAILFVAFAIQRPAGPLIDSPCLAFATHRNSLPSLPFLGRAESCSSWLRLSISAPGFSFARPLCASPGFAVLFHCISSQVVSAPFLCKTSLRQSAPRQAFPLQKYKRDADHSTSLDSHEQSLTENLVHESPVAGITPLTKSSEFAIIKPFLNQIYLTICKTLN